MSSEKVDSLDAASSIDIFSYHEDQAGRLIVDPEEAKVELGEEVAATLKLTADGKTILWPQPTDDPEDPQNWSDRRKSFQLFIIIVASIVPDFNSALGIPAIFELAKTYNTTTAEINNLTSNWSIFLIGWGGLFAVMLMRRYGRLPILFYSQLLALAFLIGATVAPNLKTFAAMRDLTGFFGTVPQVTGLLCVVDMYPFHLQARKLNLWTFGFIVSPFLSPFALGFLCARASWRWTFAVGCFYDFFAVVLIGLFMEETMYDRTVKPVPPRPTSGLRYRVETLLGLTGLKMAKYRLSWRQAFMSPLNIVWRPHLLGVLVFEAVLFGFGIGLNVCNVVFLGSPPFNWSADAISGAYGTPIVAVIVGELIGRFLNDYIQRVSIRRNNGIFEAQNRLWSCYIGVFINTVGFLVLGAALNFDYHLGVFAVIAGWFIAEVGIMISTVSIYAYCNDCFPKHQGEISALLALARILGGFSVAFYQVPWAAKNGTLQTFGVEAAIVIGVFLIVVPFLQIKGAGFRERFSI
ncbi:major facilitator superfamily domain-containing protein [Mycena floridula]|nr:major facilitator superfamily domain-containing protein [Mycena floridula]